MFEVQTCTKWLSQKLEGVSRDSMNCIYYYELYLLLCFAEKNIP